MLFSILHAQRRAPCLAPCTVGRLRCSHAVCALLQSHLVAESGSDYRLTTLLSLPNPASRLFRGSIAVAPCVSLALLI